MRAALVCFLLSGCSLIDSVADGGTGSSSRVFLGSDSVVVPIRDEMDRYTCGAQPMICDKAGSRWICSCSGFSLVRP